MIKQFFLIMLTVFLLSSINVAKGNKQDEYNKLVDYVNCYYLKAFIETKISEQSAQISQDYKTDFIDNNKVKLTFKSYEQTPNYRTILKIIGNYPNAIQLAEYINLKKDLFDENWTKDIVINHLLELPKNKPSVSNNGFFGYLSGATKMLKNDLETQIPDNLFLKDKDEQKESLKITEDSKNSGTLTTREVVNLRGEETATNQPQAQSREKRGKNDSKTSKFNYNVIIYIIVIAGLFYFLYKYRRRIKNGLTRVKLNSYKSKESDNINFYKKEWERLELENSKFIKLIKELRTEKDKFLQEKEKLEGRISDLEEEIIKIKKKIPPELKSDKEITDNNIVNRGKDEGHFLSKPTQLYADAIINGEFYRTKEQPNDDTVFELKLTPSAKQATFIIYPEAFRRVIKNPDFVDGCEKQKINPQPNNLEIEKGEAILDDFGKWKITKKAIVKFV